MLQNIKMRLVHIFQLCETNNCQIIGDSLGRLNMATQDFPSFDPEIIAHALETAQRHNDTLRTAAADAPMQLTDGALSVSAQCVSVTVTNGQVCLNLPLGIGSVCLPVPAWVPDGTAAQACLDICTKWGIPCGVQVTVSVAGQQIIAKGFGCSC